MKTYTLPVIGLMTLGASAFAAAAPSTGNSLPARDNFSACKWLGDRFKWFNSERDHKNPYIQAASWVKRNATAAASTMNGAASVPGST